MQTKTTLGILSLIVAGFAAASMLSCSQIREYSIDAPDDIQTRIDSIANESVRKQEIADSIEAAKAAAFEARMIDDLYQVGATDNSSGWWGDHSKYYPLATTSDTVYVKFKNFTGAANVWCNWVIAVTSDADRNADGYLEYAIWRADNCTNFAWGTLNGVDFNTNTDDTHDNDQTTNYSDMATDNSADNSEYQGYMNGADCIAQVTRGNDTVYVKMTMTALSGKKLTKEITIQDYDFATEPLRIFFTIEGCHLVFYKTLYPAIDVDDSWVESHSDIDPNWQVTEVVDYPAASIVATGMPKTVEIKESGEYNIKDYFGESTVTTVTFEDSNTATVDTTELSFTVPDLTIAGVKTIVYSYSKTKQGNYGKSVANSYQIEMINAPKSLEVTTAPTYTEYYAFADEDSTAFDSRGIVVTATFSDGSTAVLENSMLTFGKVPSKVGSQEVVISYVGATSTVSTTCTVTVKEGAIVAADAEYVGAEDFSNGWWTTFSKDYTVPAGTKLQFRMKVASDNGGNWHSPCIVLRNINWADSNHEYAVFRQDNYGWGDDNYSSVVLSSDWNWDTFASNINGSKVILSVTNFGTGLANVHYDVVDGSGDTHYQDYSNVTVDADDLSCALVTEESYLTIDPSISL